MLSTTCLERYPKSTMVFQFSFNLLVPAHLCLYLTSNNDFIYIYMCEHIQVYRTRKRKTNCMSLRFEIVI